MGFRTRPAQVLAAALAVLLIPALAGLAALEAAEEGALDRRPLTAEEGQRVAEAALHYARLTLPGSTDEPGVPYVWGGRISAEEYLRRAGSEESGQKLGVDASGLAVNALRALGPVRFAHRQGDRWVYTADTNSRALYEYNVEPVPPRELRAGDLLFFGDDQNVTGVAVVTGRQGERVDFVVASQRAGRVIQTFARIDGPYWQDHILGGGRFLLSAAEQP